MTDELLDKQTLVEHYLNSFSRLCRPVLSYPNLDPDKCSVSSVIPDKVIREVLVNGLSPGLFDQQPKIQCMLRAGWKSVHPVAYTLSLKNSLGNSAPRNQFLLKYLDNMKYIDGLGRGPDGQRNQGNFSTVRVVVRLAVPSACPR